MEEALLDRLFVVFLLTAVLVLVRRRAKSPPPPAYVVLQAPVSSRYQLQLPPLGRGAYGSVYAATCTTTGATVAVKVVARRFLTARDASMLRSELLLLSELAHPNIIHMHPYVFETPREVAIVTELASGGEVLEHLSRQQMKRRGGSVAAHGQARHRSGSGGGARYGEADAARVLRQLLSALAYLHARGVVHRDVKPENLLYSTRDSATATLKLVDFGFAVRQEVQQEGGLTEMVGTLPFMAPELFQVGGGGNEHGSGGGGGGGEAGRSLRPKSRHVRIGRACCDYDAKVDVYAAGVVAFLMLVGRLPLEPERAGMVLTWERLHCSLGGVSSVAGSALPVPDNADGAASAEERTDAFYLSEAARGLLRAMLARDPVQRPSAQALLDSPVFGAWLRREGGMAAGGEQQQLLPQHVCTGLSRTLGERHRRQLKRVQQQRVRKAKQKSATRQRSKQRSKKWQAAWE